MDYAAFTGALVAGLGSDERVVGVVAVGSMAAVDYEPDEWSDHDFFVVTPTGGQEELRRDLTWLPWHDRVVHSFRETEHGVKVVYDDGHLLELAVFDEEELEVAAVNRYRVLLDRGGVAERMREVAGRPRQAPSDDHLFGMLVTNALVAEGRARRGERLSGGFFAVSAARHLCALLARVLPSARASLLDDLDPLRRFELAYPKLGSEIAGAGPVELLDIAERELRPARPGLDWAGLDAVRDRIARAG